MARKAKKIFIGVAWPYVNDIFHIGNLAGAYLPPDIFARFHKLKGNRVLMVSGSDFHGTPITLRAEKEGKKPEEIAQKFHKLDIEYLKKFRIDYTIYTSTHTENHRRIVQEIFLKLLKRGFIKILKTEQLYSKKSQKFLQDRYIEGECPYCHTKDARGDQCEKCGRVLEALELLNPISKLDKSPLVRKMTENYFLDLDKLQGEVKKWLLKQKKMRDWVKNEAMGWIEEGLKPRAITRDLDYGVLLPVSKIPKEKRIENIENKVFYVWFEAVIGYLSASIEYSNKIKKPHYWRDFFYDQKAETYYFVGQDNLVFHTINWPAQLIAYDKKINLPNNVFVNKFLLLEGQKMSKSRKWFIDTPYFVKNYPIDALRFYLALNMPEQKEFNFTWSDFIETNNNVLVGTIGNFIHRILTFTQKNIGNELTISSRFISTEIKNLVKKTFVKTDQRLEKGEFRDALQEIIKLADFGNKYVEKNQVWKLIKRNKQKTKEVIINSLFIIDSLRILLFPFIPESSEKLNSLLGYKKKSFLKEGYEQWILSNGNRTIKIAGKINPLFSKIDTRNIEKEIQTLINRTIKSTKE